jgi:hypothetical protein
MSYKDFEVYNLTDGGGGILHNQMLVDGMRIPTFRKPPEETAAILRNIKHLKIRDDDIMLCTPVKSGKCILQLSSMIFVVIVMYLA